MTVIFFRSISGLITLAFLSSISHAALTFSFPDVKGPPGKIAATVQVAGGDEVTSINVAIGTTLLSGDPGSKLIIESFDPMSPTDSIWGSKPLLAQPSPPGLPNSIAKLNIAIASPGTTAQGTGSVFGIVFDASGAMPGDVFGIDLNVPGIGTTASLGADILTDLVFNNGRVTIESSPFSPGDFNQDGLLDAADIDSLTSVVKQKSNDLSFDLNSSGTVDNEDRRIWIEDIRRTYFGDSNLDMQFDSADFVEVFVAGEYEDLEPLNSSWATGDWNGDCEFDSGDFVLAFVSGAYEKGPRAAVSTVPEPSAYVTGVMMLAWMTSRRWNHGRHEHSVL